MPFTGRYHLVRNWWLPTMTVGPPLVLDRRDKQLHPYQGNGAARDEWGPRDDRREALRRWRSVKRRVADQPTARRQLRLAERLLAREADCARVAALLGQSEAFPLKLFVEQALSLTTVSLNNNYVAGTSGNAYATRHLCPPGGRTINNVYFFVSSYTGTAANVTDLNLELRPEASAGSGNPNTASLTESKTVNPSSATGWINSSGWTSTLTALARNFFIVGDANGNATDFAVCTSRSQFFDSGVGNTLLARYGTYTTTSGWSSGNTSSNQPASLVLKFSDGSVIGQPLTANTAPASDTNRRGLRITSGGLVASLPVFGMLWTVTNANISGMEIYGTANNPGTSPDNTSTDLLYNGGAGRVGCLTSGGTPYTLAAGTAYRIVTTNSGANTGGPQRMDIGTGSNSDLTAAMPGGGNFYYARANGTTDWSNDLTTSFPAVGLLIDGQAAASSGGGNSIIGSGIVNPMLEGAA